MDVQEAPVAAVPLVQVPALACRAFPLSVKSALQLAQYYCLRTRKKPQLPRCRQCRSNAGASVGLTRISIQREACGATCTKPLPSDVQEVPAAAVPLVQVQEIA